MSRFFLGFIILAGLLLAFNIPVQGFTKLMAFLLIVAAGFSLIVSRKLPHNFLATLAGLIIGPVLICCLIRALFSHSEGIFSSSFGSVPATLVLLILMAISFLYVRARLTHLKSNEGKQLHTNERRPVLPAPNEHDGGV
jgi:hypothetical protein